MTSPDLQNRSRRFVLLFSLSTVSLLGSVAVLNFCVDPSALYGPDAFTPVIQTSRAEKLRLLQQLPQQPDGLILGSSRVLKLEPSFIENETGLTFFNAGVNYARPEDHLAWIRYWIELYGQPPEFVILGIDPSSFDDAVAPDARLVAEHQLARELPDFLTLEDRLARWKALLSWRETKLSLRSLKTHWLDGGPPAPVEHYLPDGQIVYDKRESEIKEGVYDFPAALEFNQGEYLAKYQQFQSASERRMNCFQSTVRLCRAYQIELIVFVTPMHPELATYLDHHSDFEARRDEVIESAKKITLGNAFSFVDLSDIRSFDGDPDCFVDGVHPLEPNTRKMVKRLLEHGSPYLAEIIRMHQEDQLARLDENESGSSISSQQSQSSN